MLPWLRRESSSKSREVTRQSRLLLRHLLPFRWLSGGKCRCACGYGGIIKRPFTFVERSPPISQLGDPPKSRDTTHYNKSAMMASKPEERLTLSKPAVEAAPNPL